MTTIDLDQLATVTGGAGSVPDPNNNSAFGRCGPGTGMPILGNIYTPQCAAHDAAVRSSQASGASKVWSHIQALPLLPAAVGSWIGAKLRGQ